MIECNWKTGDKAKCTQCKENILFNGKLWEHVNHTPRHQATPRISSIKHITTDEWTDQHPLFRNNVDSAIQNLTNLRGEEAYGLRRMIMIFTRQEFT